MEHPSAVKISMIERLKPLITPERRKATICAALVVVSAIVLAIMALSATSGRSQDYAKPAADVDVEALAKQVRALKWDMCAMENPIHGIDVSRKNGIPLPVAALTAISELVAQCESVIRSNAEQEARDREVMQRAALEDQQRLEASRRAAASEATAQQPQQSPPATPQ